MQDLKSLKNSEGFRSCDLASDAMKRSGGKATKIDRKKKRFQVSIKFTFTPLCGKGVREFLHSFMRWLHAEKAALSGKVTRKWSKSAATSLIHPFPHLKTWVKNQAKKHTTQTHHRHIRTARGCVSTSTSPQNGWWHPSTPNPTNDQVSFPIRDTLHHEHHQQFILMQKSTPQRNLARLPS